MYKYSPEPHENKLRNNRNSQAILEGLGNNTFNFLIEVELIYNVVLISAIQQSDSFIHAYIYILLHYGLSQDIEYSSLCCTVGPCCLSILVFNKIQILLVRCMLIKKFPSLWLIFLQGQLPFSEQKFLILVINLWDFSGGTVVRTPRFHCTGHGFDPWLGN